MEAKCDAYKFKPLEENAELSHLKCCSFRIYHKY